MWDLLDIATRKIDWLTSDKWEIEAGAFSPDGKSLTWTANVDGNTNIYSYDLAGRHADRAAHRAGRQYLGRQSHGLHARRLEAPLLPQRRRTLPAICGSMTSRRSSRSRSRTRWSADCAAPTWLQPYLVHYPSRDGKWTISAFAYVPNNIQRNGKFPAIVYIHGGPAAQSVNSFNRFIQYIVNQGYLVIAPNYRGSTGYGKEFIDANIGDAGGGDLNDVLDAAEWIKKSGFVDPKKLIVMGGSYGGYLSMMAVTKAPDMWAAAVPIVPFVNWFTEIANEDPSLREYDLATMGDPVKNKALYEDRSPINFVDQIKAPIAAAGGRQRSAMPGHEAQQVADAVKKNGGMAQLKIYKDEGHGFSRVENQIDAYQTSVGFPEGACAEPGLRMLGVRVAPLLAFSFSLF